MPWIPYLNSSLVIILFGVFTLFFCWRKDEKTTLTYPPDPIETVLPKRFFPESENYDLNLGALSLNWVPPLMQLPDLRHELQFFGKNKRPDGQSLNAFYYLGLKSSGEMDSIQENKRLYLIYQGNYSPQFLNPTFYQNSNNAILRPLWGEEMTENKSSYLFSPDNKPTSLWLEVSSINSNSISLYVKMLDEKDNVIERPQEFSLITLPIQEFPKSQTTGWELGPYRVDSTLLVRQKARWIGGDRFLEMHGGDEYDYVLGCEKIDFLDGETPYSCFVRLGDILVWKNNQWKRPSKDEVTEGYPILYISKIDEKILSLELWDSGGWSKTTLNLIRTKDHHKFPNLKEEFKFVGAKTWAQFIIECSDGKRLEVKPNDWLILKQEGWEKINSSEQIDEYVQKPLVGPLFVFDKMIKKNGRHLLSGHLFNLSRTEVEEVEIEASPHAPLANFHGTRMSIPSSKLKISGKEE
ncbi:MAG: hypothetical protein R3E91_03630 [Chlamydiales bacterium]